MKQLCDEERLCEVSAERLRSLMNGVSDVIYHMSLPDGRYQYVSPAAVAVFGYSPEELYADPAIVRRIFHPEWLPYLDEQWERMLRGDVPPTYEYQIVHKSGAVRWINQRNTLVKNADGRPTAIEGVITDVTDRKRAELALRESGEKYRWLIETTDTGYVIIDEQGRVVDANQKYTQLTGRSRVDEIIGHNVIEWTAPHDVERNADELRRCNERGSVRDLAVDYLTLDGRIVPVEINATMLKTAGALRILSVCRDISERKRAEEALVLSELTYREIFNAVNDAIWVHDLVTGRFLDANEAVTRMFGYSVAEAKELSVGDISSGVPPFTDDTARSLLEKAAGGAPQLFEWHCRHKDGHLFWSEVILRRGTVAGKDCVLAIERDITARKRAEMALRESEERYRAFVANSSEGICRFEVNPPISTALPVEQQVELILQRAYFAECNDALARMYGLERAEQLVNTPIREFWGGDQKYLEFLGRIVRLDYRVLDDESEEKGLDGAMRCFSNSVIGIVENDFLVRGWGVQRDITDRKRSEAELLLNEARFRSLANVLQYQGESTQEFLDFALQEALVLTGSRLGYLYIYNEKRREFVLNTWSRDVMKECAVADPQCRYDLDRTGLWGEAVRQRRPILLNDFQAPHLLKRGFPVGHAALSRFLTIPVFSGENVVAVVGLANKAQDYGEKDIHQVRLLMDAVWKVVEQRKALEALRESEERFAVFMKHLPAGAFMKDETGKVVYANDYLVSLFGWEDMIGRSTRELLPAELADRMEADDRDALARGAIILKEHVRDSTDRERIFQTGKFPITRHGKPPLLGGISVEITELERAQEALRSSLEEKESLLREVHHRVKNNLQVISSLLNLQLRNVKNEEVRAFLRDTQNRIHSMAMLHEILYRSGNIADVQFPLYLKRLCDHLARSQGAAARQIRLRQEIADVPLNPDQAITAGLIVNELVTNAIKHAFPSDQGGEVIVALRPDDEDRLLLRVADNGIGLPPGAPTEAAGSLGLLLVRSLCRQLSGELSIKNGQPGAVFEIVFPHTPKESR
jgi:two-component system, sensor histidine kinase and response regulator